MSNVKVGHGQSSAFMSRSDQFCIYGIPHKRKKLTDSLALREAPAVVYPASKVDRSRLLCLQRTLMKVGHSLQVRRRRCQWFSGVHDFQLPQLGQRVDIEEGARVVIRQVKRHEHRFVQGAPGTDLAATALDELRQALP